MIDESITQTRAPLAELLGLIDFEEER